MKAPALIGVDAGPEAFAALFAAARAARVRLGWLDLSSPAVAPTPPELESAAALGALRAVAIGGGRAVTLKPLTGAPVLRDLLREHFLGCVAVLARGVAGWPRLAPEGDEFRLRLAADRERRLAAVALLAELARPRYRAAEPES